MVDMTSNETSLHEELKLSQMKISEQGVTNIKEAFMGFNNPLTIKNKDELFCLSSGLPTSSEVLSSLLLVKEFGKTAMNAFINEILKEKNIKFHQPNMRIKSKTFASMRKCKKLKSSQNKLFKIRAKRNVFV